MISKIFSCLVVLVLINSCGENTFQNNVGQKIKGFVFTGPGNGPYQEQMFTSMVKVNGNYVALVPEATVMRQNLNIEYNFSQQWYGETKTGLLDGISLARKNGMKIMIKPHLTVQWDMSGWDKPELNMQDSLSRANYTQSVSSYLENQENKVDGKSSWRGDFMTKSEEDWFLFEKEYTDFILDYAQIADSLDVEVFCIGTEMKRVALEKPIFFRRLIKEVRNVFKGELTYAANWDSYNRIQFWDDLDYIGVDAYFPLSDKQQPTLDEMNESWKRISKELSAVSGGFNLPILFTEWGYEDEDYVAKEPWIMTKSVKLKNETLQELAFKSMFESVWSKPWMKGVFVWRWEPFDKSNRPSYTPTSKKAENVLKEEFKKISE